MTLAGQAALQGAECYSLGMNRASVETAVVHALMGAACRERQRQEEVVVEAEAAYLRTGLQAEVGGDFVRPVGEEEEVVVVVEEEEGEDDRVEAVLKVLHEGAPEPVRVVAAFVLVVVVAGDVQKIAERDLEGSVAAVCRLGWTALTGVSQS